jgi:hypothetical protein
MLSQSLSYFKEESKKQFMKFSSHAIVDPDAIDRPICILEFTKFRIYILHSNSIMYI